MAREPRLDTPRTPRYEIVRGIEQGKIDDDRVREQLSTRIGALAGEDGKPSFRS